MRSRWTIGFFALLLVGAIAWMLSLARAAPALPMSPRATPPAIARAPLPTPPVPLVLRAPPPRRVPRPVEKPHRSGDAQALPVATSKGPILGGYGNPFYSWNGQPPAVRVVAQVGDVEIGVGRDLRVRDEAALARTTTRLAGEIGDLLERKLRGETDESFRPLIERYNAELGGEMHGALWVHHPIFTLAHWVGTRDDIPPLLRARPSDRAEVL